MKTMKKGDDIVRVDESKQFDFLRRGYEYVAKKIWKEKVRDVNRTEEPKKVEKIETKNTETKKKSTKVVSNSEPKKKPGRPKKAS